MTNKTTFFFKSASILISEYFRYLISKDYDTCIIKMVDKLAEQNIFYVKIIQALSTNSHLFTDELIEYMSKYTDNIPYSNDDINDDCFKDICMYNLANPDKKLLIKSDKPINTGTVSLVYKGSYDNKYIVIKMIRQNMKYNVSDMLNNLNGIIKFLGTLPYFKSVHLYEIFEENKELLIQQTDFKKEVAHIQQMIHNYINNNEYIIPNVYSEFTELNPDMIVMDFIDGKTLYDVEEKDAEIYEMLLSKFGIKNLLFNRLYHADMHPGNILFIKTPANEYKLGILDYGIMGVLTRDEQDNFYQFITTLFVDNVDYKKLLELLLLFYIEPQERIQELKIKDKTRIDNEITSVIKLAINNSGQLGTQELFNINRILIEFKLKLSRKFCKILLALAISESVTTKLGDNKKNYVTIKTAVKELFPTHILDY